MNKFIISIIVIIIAASLGAVLLLQKPALPEPLKKIAPQANNQPQVNILCGDGICDANEKANPNLCPQDCAGQTITQPTNRPTTTSTTKPVSQPTVTPTKQNNQTPIKQTLSSSQDSPFGFLSIPPTEFEYYKDLATSWIVVGEFDWSIIEREKGKYDFSGMDKQLSNWTQHGLNLHYRIRPINKIYGTYWDEFGESDEYPDGHLDAWANFIEKFAERYDGDGVDDAPTTPKIVINSYQLVHELSPPDKNYWLSHPEQYAEVFEVTYKSLKKANPKAVLYMPVPAPREILKQMPVPDFLYQWQDASDNFLPKVFSLLKDKGITDIGFDYHQFNLAPPSTQLENTSPTKTYYYLHAKHIDYIKKTASQYGFSNALIMSAESGTPGTEKTESVQAGYVIRSYVISLAHGQKRQFWTTITEYANSTIFSYFGLVNNPKNKDGLSHKKLSYYTYKKMVDILDGSDWSNIQTIQEKDGVYIYKFTGAGKPIWVAWNDNSGSKQITISGISSSSVKITEAVPKYESGKDVNDYSTAFNTETKSVFGGKILITLGDKPVFVEKK